MTSYALSFLIGALIGLFFGWGLAHTTVATECEKLGGFFVTDKVFECKRVQSLPKAKQEPDHV